MVKIGDVNVKDIPKEELMNTVSFVTQNSRLIKASILENVRMGKPEATREEVLAALHHAQCDDILEKLHRVWIRSLVQRVSIFPAASSNELPLPV